ncbi:hypothetical protein CBR_g23452 [Chara braunii]|uniref:Myb-like domain-containing protein n=1 Tax=Chara braunii TaxID=69332 RepID=A0A388L494_CHABU|nr:hypothetical protein CBR_g23452 [Chara braunii]|eukprot:GBG77126.1 hypothetical protein CBR_g23452 [Chara braunii]
MRHCGSMFMASELRTRASGRFTAPLMANDISVLVCTSQFIMQGKDMEFATVERTATAQSPSERACGVYENLAVDIPVSSAMHFSDVVGKVMCTVGSEGTMSQCLAMDAHAGGGLHTSVTSVTTQDNSHTAVVVDGSRCIEADGVGCAHSEMRVKRAHSFSQRMIAVHGSSRMASTVGHGVEISMQSKTVHTYDDFQSAMIGCLPINVCRDGGVHSTRGAQTLVADCQSPTSVYGSLIVDGRGVGFGPAADKMDIHHLRDMLLWRRAVAACDGGNAGRSQGVAGHKRATTKGSRRGSSGRTATDPIGSTTAPKSNALHMNKGSKRACIADLNGPPTSMPSQSDNGVSASDENGAPGNVAGSSGVVGLDEIGSQDECAVGVACVSGVRIPSAERIDGDVGVVACKKAARKKPVSNPGKTPNWGDDETMMLLSMRCEFKCGKGEDSKALGKACSIHNVWGFISARLIAAGFERTRDMCKNRWNFVYKNYKLIVDNDRRSGAQNPAILLDNITESHGNGEP